MQRPVIKRRGPFNVGPPPNNATPVRFIPKIRQIQFRQQSPRGIVDNIVPPRPTFDPKLKRQILPIEVGVNYRANGSVTKVAPPKPTFDPKNKRQLVTRVILNSYRRDGIVSRILRPFPAPAIAARVPLSHFIGSSFRLNGMVYTIKPLKLTFDPKRKRLILISNPRGREARPLSAVYRIHPVFPTFDPKRKRLIPVNVFIGKDPRFPFRGSVRVVRHNHITFVIDPCSWQGHFISHGWASPQDQVDAGYPIYIEPTLTTGSYKEVFDFGVIFGSVIVNLNWSVDIYTGNVSVNPVIRTSPDNATWSTPVAGSSVFGTNVRYVEVTVNFTGTNDKSLIGFYNFQIFLDVKREVDSGNGTANAADTTGTVVTFNKSFKSVDSITITTKSLEPIYAIYDFTNVPNPTTFKVLIFDSAGQRITFPFSWKARGIV